MAFATIRVGGAAFAASVAFVAQAIAARNAVAVEIARAGIAEAVAAGRASRRDAAREILVMAGIALWVASAAGSDAGRGVPAQAEDAARIELASHLTVTRQRVVERAAAAVAVCSTKLAVDSTTVARCADFHTRRAIRHAQAAAAIPAGAAQRARNARATRDGCSDGATHAERVARELVAFSGTAIARGRAGVPRLNAVG